MFLVRVNIVKCRMSFNFGYDKFFPLKLKISTLILIYDSS